MTKLSQHEQDLIAAAAYSAVVKPHGAAPSAPPPPRPLIGHPHLVATIARLAGVIAERAPAIARVEAEQQAAVGELAALVSGLRGKVTELEAARAERASAAADAEAAAQAAEREAEQQARAHLAAAEAYANSLRAAAATHAGMLRTRAARQREAALECEARRAATSSLFTAEWARLQHAAAPFELQLKRLRQGPYREAQRRLPELRARLAARQSGTNAMPPAAVCLSG